MSMKNAAETGAKVMNGRTFCADDIRFAAKRRRLATGAAERSPQGVALGGAFVPAVNQAMVPLTIGWNAVTASRTAWVDRPVFGRMVVKFPCSPCSAM